MELVLNKCFGGFGLSHMAKMKILEKKGIKDFNFYDISRLDNLFWRVPKNILLILSVILPIGSIGMFLSISHIKSLFFMQK